MCICGGFSLSLGFGFTKFNSLGFVRGLDRSLRVSCSLCSGFGFNSEPFGGAGCIRGLRFGVDGCLSQIIRLGGGIGLGVGIGFGRGLRGGFSFGDNLCSGVSRRLCFGLGRYLELLDMELAGKCVGNHGLGADLFE
ncbi:MAG TPA: hypothetical protein DEO85_13935 [Maritimibacter sp.]|nr:hypothetical protein [Maritimibacter sp.]